MTRSDTCMSRSILDIIASNCASDCASCVSGGTTVRADELSCLDSSQTPTRHCLLVLDELSIWPPSPSLCRSSPEVCRLTLCIIYFVSHGFEGKRIPGLPKETTTYLQGSTRDLYHRIAAEARFDVHRLRITKEDGALVPNDKSVTIASLGLKDGSVVQVKDLGTCFFTHLTTNISILRQSRPANTMANSLRH